MKKKLLVLGLTCLLSQGAYAQDTDEQAGVEEVSAQVEPEGSSSSDEANVDQENTGESNTVNSQEIPLKQEGDNLAKEDDKSFYSGAFDKLSDGCSWVSTHKKIVAGLAGMGAVVYWIYNYGCECCSKRTVERAE